MSRLLIALLTAVQATAGITAAAVASDPTAGDVLPDLDMEVPKDLSVERVKLGEHTVFRLGFAAASANVGRAPLTLHGQRIPGTETMQVRQLVTQADGGLRSHAGAGRMRYVVHPDHRHWHLLDYASYQLRIPGDDRPSLRSDRKTGFCLGDRYTIDNAKALSGYDPVPRQGDTCGLGQPKLNGLFAGISPGYGDRYEAQLEGQYIDITDAPARKYVLVHQVNEDGKLLETTRANNASSVLFQLSWPNGRRALPRIVVLRRCPASASCPG